MVANGSIGSGLVSVDETAMRPPRRLILTQGCATCVRRRSAMLRTSLGDCPSNRDCLPGPHRLEDVLADVERIGRAAGLEDRSFR